MKISIQLFHLRMKFLMYKLNESLDQSQFICILMKFELSQSKSMIFINLKNFWSSMRSWVFMMKIWWSHDYYMMICVNSIYYFQFIILASVFQIISFKYPDFWPHPDVKSSKMKIILSSIKNETSLFNKPFNWKFSGLFQIISLNK